MLRTNEKSKLVTGTLADIVIGRRSVNRSRQELRLSDFFYEVVR